MKRDAIVDLPEIPSHVTVTVPGAVECTPPIRIPITQLTYGEAEEYAQLMKDEFLKRWEMGQGPYNFNS